MIGPLYIFITMLNELFNDINKARNIASIGEKRKWGDRWYMKTPRGWVLTNEEVNKITDEAFRAREEELERRINEDPEFRARYQKDYGEGYTTCSFKGGYFNERSRRYPVEE